MIVKLTDGSFAAVVLWHHSIAPAVHVYLIALNCTRGPGGRVSGHFKTVSCGILKLNMSWREFVILLIQTNHDTAADTPTDKIPSSV